MIMRLGESTIDKSKQAGCEVPRNVLFLASEVKEKFVADCRITIVKRYYVLSVGNLFVERAS
jgi:hypothetical protein